MALEKFDRFNHSLIKWFEDIGLIGILLMMVITCVDVIGAKVFLKPVFGALDIVMISQLIAVSFATASVLIMGKHVSVEFFMLLFPERSRAALTCAVDLLQLALFITIVWRLAAYGYSFQEGGEVSSTARIPLYPFVYGAALACVPICFVLVVDFVQSLTKAVKK